MASPKTKAPPELLASLEKWFLEWNTVKECANYCYPYPEGHVKDRIVAEANKAIAAHGCRVVVTRDRLNTLLQNLRCNRKGCSRMLERLIKERHGPDVTIEMISARYGWRAINNKATRASLNWPRSNSSLLFTSHHESPESNRPPLPPISALSNGLTAEGRKDEVVVGLEQTSISPALFPASINIPVFTEFFGHPAPTIPPEFSSHPDSNINQVSHSSGVINGLSMEEEKDGEVVGLDQTSSSAPQLPDSTSLRVLPEFFNHPQSPSSGVCSGLTMEEEAVVGLEHTSSSPPQFPDSPSLPVFPEFFSHPGSTSPPEFSPQLPPSSGVNSGLSPEQEEVVELALRLGHSQEMQRIKRLLHCLLLTLT